jgi:hypothetical protein
VKDSTKTSEPAVPPHGAVPSADPYNPPPCENEPPCDHGNATNAPVSTCNHGYCPACGNAVGYEGHAKDCPTNDAEPAVPPVPAEPRSAEQFYKEWAESNPESLWATKRPAKVAIAFAEAYAQSIREQLAAAEAQAEFAEDVATNLRERFLSAQKEIDRLRPDVKEFAGLMSAAMDSKAIERDTRQQPHYMSADYQTVEALPRMREKLDELLYALGQKTDDDFRTFTQTGEPNLERALKTAVHLANFCMIVAAKARATLAQEKK